MDNAPHVGKFASIAIDSNDKVHISYSDATGDYSGFRDHDLKYATNASGSWVVETIDSEGIVGVGTAIVVDSNNKVHIAYCDYTHHALKYATNVSGAWVTETVDSTSYLEEDISIAIDSNDKVHISYSDRTVDYNSGPDPDLKYATNASGSWVTSTIDSTGYVGTHNSIAVDSNDKVHISYYFWDPYNETNNGLKYATNASGSWTTETVDSGRYYDSSIAIDSNDKVHISYFDALIWELKHTTNASGSWVAETVDSEGNVGEYTSIAMDSNDKVHIKYYGSGGVLKYTTNTSGSWVTETVDISGTAGARSYIKVDSNDSVHIAYVGSDGLKHTTNASGSWVAETVDIGEYSDSYIVIDSNNKLHISYCERPNHDFKYTTNASGSWVTETVDENCEGNISMAVDSNNKAHIIFSYSGSFSDLKYATNASGTWVVETVDENSGGSFIAVDSNNKVHITYTTQSHNFEYATNASGTWVRETINNLSGDPYSSIAIDSNDKVHISTGYYRPLRYTTNVSGSWINSMIVDEVNVNYGSSIAIDSNNKAHISYHDITNGILKYATNASGLWATEIVDDAEQVGYFSSMAVDSNGQIHISYYDDALGDLKYAYGYGDAGSVSPTSHNFGSVNVGTSSVPQTFTISNIGTADLHYSGISLSDSANYSLDANGGINPCGSTTPTIAPDGSCTVTVTFNPTSTGTKNVNLTLSTDEPGETNVNVPLTGNGIPFEITLLLPNGGEILPSGGTYASCWEAPSNAVKFVLKYSTDKYATTWNLLKSVTGLNCSAWNVPVLTANKNMCRVKVIGYDSKGLQIGEDISDMPFTIEVLRVTSPKGKEALKSGNTSTIQWTTYKTIRPVAKTVLQYTTNNGRTWNRIKTLAGNPGFYVWTVPSVTTIKKNCKVKVILKDASGVNVGTDVSDKVFTIQP